MTSFATGASRSRIQELASLSSVERAENIVLLGPSGTGKTYLAIAFGLIAAQKSWKVRTTAADLVIAMEAACGQGRMKEMMHRAIAAPGRRFHPRPRPHVPLVAPPSGMWQPLSSLRGCLSGRCDHAKRRDQDE
jgi:hypothetical protein